MVSDTESGSDSSSGSISPSMHRRRSPHSPLSEHSRDNIVHDNGGEDDDKSNLSAVSTGSATNSPMAIESQSKTDNNYGLRKKNCKRDSENVSEKKMNNLVDDLSDVSDSDNDDSHLSKYDLDVEVNSNDSVKSEKENQDETNLCKKFQEKITKLEDTEEQLDFEAEDVDVTDVQIAPSCTASQNSVGIDNCAKSTAVDSGEDNGEESDKKNDSNDGGDELEEGEVSDDDEARPEEVEPKPVCKFYSRGLCTWGMSCRFLHPGVMDKGNYTMFDIIRPAVPDIVPKSEERIAVGPNSTTGTVSSVETAWERGLRTAKEMVRRANKRKEQDSDFEEKKMTLTRSPEDTDKENGFYNRNSPDPPVPPMRHYQPIRTNLPPLPVPAHEYLPPPPPSRYTHDYYNRRFYFDDRPESDIIISRERGGIRTYREVPVSRIPPHPAYYSKYNDELAIENALKRHGGAGNRSKREVILQRVDPSITMKNRVYDYPDPWVTRNKSPIKGRFSKSGHRKGSYSSQSSYSSSSSSSRSSSASSRSSYGKSRSKSLSPSRIRSSRRQKSPSPLPPPPVPQPQSSSSSSSQSKRTNRKYTSPQQSSTQQHSSISVRKAEIGRDSPMGQPNSRRPYKNTKPSSPQHAAHRSSSNVLIKGDFDDSSRNRGDRKKTNLSTRNTSVVTNTTPITNTTTAIKTSTTRKRALSRSSTASESSSSSSSTGSESSGSSSSSGRRKSPRNTAVSRSKHRTRSKRDRRLSETKKPQSPVLQSMSPPPLQLNLKRSIKLNLKPPNLNSPTPPPIQPPPQKKLLIIPDFCMPNEPESKTDSGKKTSLDTNESLVGKKRSVSSISLSTPIVKDNDSSVPDVKSNINKSKASRREELLKQLKAVEDAIAKKRSKLS